MTGSTTITVFRTRRWLLFIYLALGIIFAVQGVATAAYFATVAEGGAGLTLLMIGVAAFVAFLGYWFGMQAWRRLRDPEAPIVIGPSGLYDRALSERPIPWRDIRDIHVWRNARGGELVVFDFDDAAGERAGLRKGRRTTASINRRFGYGYQIYPLGTDATVSRLVAAIRAFAQVRTE